MADEIPSSIPVTKVTPVVHVDYPYSVLSELWNGALTYHIPTLSEEPLEGFPIDSIERVFTIVLLQIRNPNHRKTVENRRTGILCQINAKVLVSAFQVFLELSYQSIRGIKTPIDLLPGPPSSL